MNSGVLIFFVATGVPTLVLAAILAVVIALAIRRRKSASPADPDAAPSRVGVGWKVSIGLLALLLVFVAWRAVATYSLISNSLAAYRPPATVVVPSTKVGAPWFSVSANGRGTFQAWDDGFASQAGGTSEPEGSVLFADVGVPEVVDGVLITHVARVYMTAKTVIVIGGQPYKKGSAASQANAYLNDDSNEDALSAGMLTIDFHRDGTAIVADRVSESTTNTANPLRPY